MSVRDAINYDDLRRMAKRRLPRLAYDFIEGGVDGEEGLDTNFDAFSRRKLVPKYLLDTSTPDRRTTLFGRSYAMPFGIAPTGAAAFFRKDADLLLAQAARDADIPFIISGASTATIEQVAAVAPDHAWYQLYIARDRAISRDMVARAKAAGLSTLVFTVDVPGGAKRERNIRNGMGRPIKPTWSSRFEALRHPGWLVEYMSGSGLTASNWEKYAPPGASAAGVLDFLATQFPVPATWDDVAWIRKVWNGPFVLKGVMHPDDAKRAASMGVDGLMISNHGARQLDRAPSPVDVLPAICDAVGEKVTVMLDSGIRRGSDIVTALCMGAKFCFVGRWTLYGVTAGGRAGARHAVEMVGGEIDHVMRQLGAPDIASLGADFLMWNDTGDLARNKRP